MLCTLEAAYTLPAEGTCGAAKIVQLRGRRRRGLSGGGDGGERGLTRMGHISLGDQLIPGLREAQAVGGARRQFRRLLAEARCACSGLLEIRGVGIKTTKIKIDFFLNRFLF